MLAADSSYGLPYDCMSAVKWLAGDQTRDPQIVGPAGT